MWLLDGNSLRLVFFANEDKTPPYAILSHTWSDDEVSFQDMMSTHAGKDLETKTGWAKIKNACRVALSYGLDHVWIDTCCIDKSSSAELQEAINSMFKWYELSAICFAYLSDVSASEDLKAEGSSFRRSRWFKRGWTLQELLAPTEVAFYDKDWKPVSTRGSIGGLIGDITGIRPRYLSKKGRRRQGIFFILSTASVSERMSWMDKRETTRPEDLAYCLLGIFDINMPMLYGEGSKAFQRLQEEIMKKNDDTSLLTWGYQYQEPSSNWYLDEESLLAPHPSYFRHCRDIEPCRLMGFEAASFSMNQRGLQMEVPVRVDLTHKLLVYMILGCHIRWKVSYDPEESDSTHFVAVPLISTRACNAHRRNYSTQKEEFLRPNWCRPTLVSDKFLSKAKSASIVIRRSSKRLHTFEELPISIAIPQTPIPQGYTILGTYPPQPLGSQLISFQAGSLQNLPDSTKHYPRPFSLKKKTLQSIMYYSKHQTMIHIRIPMLGTFLVVLKYLVIERCEVGDIDCQVFKSSEILTLEVLERLHFTQDFTRLSQVKDSSQTDCYIYNIGKGADVKLVVQHPKDEKTIGIRNINISVTHPPGIPHEQMDIERQGSSSNCLEDSLQDLKRFTKSHGRASSRDIVCVQKQLRKDFPSR